MPFFEAQSSAMACSQMRSGMWLLSKMVPTFTVKGLRQGLQKRTPIRVLLPLSAVMRSVPWQRGQTGPFGHSFASTHS